MEQLSQASIKNKVGVKVFLTIIIQLIIAIPLYILGGMLLYGIISVGSIAEIMIVVIFFLISLYLTLLILGNKFIPQDIRDFSKTMGMVYLAFGILVLVFSLSMKSFNLLDIIIHLVLYPLLGYFFIRLFLQKKFSKQ